MSVPGAKSAWIAGLLLAGVAVVAEPVVGLVALGAMLVLLPAAAVMDLIRTGAALPAGIAKAVPVVGLFVCGVLVFADDQTLGTVALGATIVLLVAAGFVEGRLWAVRWAAVVVLSALTADILWQLDWDPFDRSEQYEPIGQFPFVLIGVPALMVLVAVGVAARSLWRRMTHA